jgi:antitoxin VapB
MALCIKDNEADRLAREISRITGETLTQAVTLSLKERLARLEPKSSFSSSLVEDVGRIGLRNSKRAKSDHRTAEEILGYDEDGLP